MAGRKAAIEGQLLWTVDGEDDVEASGKAAEKTVKGAGDAAKGA